MIILVIYTSRSILVVCTTFVNSHAHASIRFQYKIMFVSLIDNSTWPSYYKVCEVGSKQNNGTIQ